MKIQLNQTEIESALRLYIKHQGINLDGCHVEIGFTAGRGNNGMTADLDITPMSQTQQVAENVVAVNTQAPKATTQAHTGNAFAQPEPVQVTAPKAEVVDTPFVVDEPAAVVAVAEEADELVEDEPVVETKTAHSLFGG